MYLKINGLYLTLGNKVLFDGIDFVLNPGDKIGIVGNNGTGKSTFLKSILGMIEVQADIEKKTTSIGYLSQDETLKFAQEEGSRREELELLLKTKEVLEDLNLYTKYLDEYTQLTLVPKKDELLSLFNFDKTLFEKEQKQHFSGGETTKLKLVTLFSKNYQVYFLDEPTNHLDLQTKRKLIEYLKTLETYIIVSHDEELLSNSVTKIIEFSEGKLKSYSGNYQDYVKQKAKEDHLKEKNSRENEKRIGVIERGIEARQQRETVKLVKIANLKKKNETMKHADTMDKVYHKESLSALQKQNAIIKEKKTEELEKLKSEQEWVEDDIKIKFNDIEKPNTLPFQLLGITKRLDTFTLSIPRLDIRCEDKIAIIGPNGCGKTTLLRILHGETQVDKGEVITGDKVKVGYLSQKGEGLDQTVTLIDELISLKTNYSETVLRKYLGKMLFRGESVFKPISLLSGGEKVRLAFLKLLLEGCNVLLLDEPSNHMDIESKKILSSALKEFIGTIVVVSHDEYFLKEFVTRRITLDKGQVILDENID